MAAPHFKTPANVQDFKLPTSYQQWSDWISQQHDNNIKYSGPGKVDKCSGYAGIEDRYPDMKSQYYNETKTKVQNTNDAVISWNGFPLRSVTQYGRGTPESYTDCENATPVGKSQFLQHYFDQPDLFANVLMRTQDEYLEWFPTFDNNGNLLKVDFSCEGPEYWQNMHDWEPDTLLSLYQDYINPAVQLKDLQWVAPDSQTGKPEYNPYNKWNTTDGIMHLNCPPNSLGAEINLAAFATVPHGTKEDPITRPVPLTQCAKFGNPGRNSDPNIGAKVNAFCRQGLMITCTNPVGLYILSIDTSSWYVNGSQIPQDQIAKIVQYTRGDRSTGRNLRVTVQVPAEYGYKLTDISIGGVPLKWGGQIAETITMGLSGTAGTGPVTSAPYQACMNVTCPPRPQHVLASVGLKSEAAKMAIPAVHRFSTR